MSLTLTNKWRDAGRENKVDLIKAATLRPPVLWVTTEILVHESTPAALEALERAKTDRSIIEAPLSKACSCCGSRVCSVVERWPDLSIYIDRITGKRVKPERLTPEQRAKVEAAAEHVHLPIRVSRPQLPLLYSSDGRKDLISGGVRGGKSQVCAYAFTREWLLRGGKGANFWLVAPVREQAWKLLNRVVYGDDNAPGVLPPVLFRSIPKSEHQTTAVLVDGSILSLKHLKSKLGTNLKSDSVQAIFVDEAASMCDKSQLANIESRLHMSKGRLLMATTPTKDHWLREMVRDPCVAWELMPEVEREKNPTHPARYWRYSSLGMTNNPWCDPVHTMREMEAKGGENDPAVLREFAGIWASASGPLWRAFSLTDHIMENEFRTLQEWDTMRKRDITATVSRKLFGSYNPRYPGLRAQNHSFIAFMDVNKRPHSTLLAQISADPDDPTNRDKWTIVVWDMLQTYIDAAVHAQDLAAKKFAKMVRRDSDGETFRNIGIIADGKSVSWDPTHHSHGGSPTGLAQLFGAKGFDMRPPEYTAKGKPCNPHPPDTYLLVKRLLLEKRLLIHTRCDPLRKAFLEQEDSGDGLTPIKVSGNASDRLSSTIDALRYGCWAVFHGGPATAKMISGGGMIVR